MSVFRVFRSVLILVDQVDSGGSEPLSVAQYRNLFCVLSAAGSGSIVAFHLDGTGHLQEIANSTTYLTATNSGGSSLSISPNGQVLAVTERVPNNIDTFGINTDGTLKPIVVNKSTAPDVFDARFAPNGSLIVSETGPAGGVDASAISSYAIQPTGLFQRQARAFPHSGSRTAGMPLLLMVNGRMCPMRDHRRSLVFPSAKTDL